ncbi:MAG TPA: tetratricopeptide repeat protein [Tepidisphaeraceae bacterium]|jgi:tetratricopeptide (TPR) repeat protein
MSSRTLQTRARRRAAEPEPPPASLAPARPAPAWVPALLLVLAIVATFWPVCAHEFTNWDDGLNVTHNPRLIGHSASALLEFWRHPYQGLYIPLTYTTWWLLATVAGVDTPDATGAALNPYVFHTANLLVHLGACLAAYRLLRVLTGRPWAAWAGGMLFALHPLHVEPVAWVTGLKDLLSGLLSLLALWQYVLFARAAITDEGNRTDDRANAEAVTDHRAWHYAAATGALIGALLSKPSAITVPLMAAAVDLWVVRRPLRRVVVSLLPWMAVAGTFCLIGVYAQPVAAGIGANAGADAGPIWMRPLIAGDTLAFYMGKFLLPIGLAPIYPHSIKHVLSSTALWVAWLAPAALATVAWVTRRRAPWVAAAAAIFIAAPLPVLGLVPFAYAEISTAADRYVYLGLLGPALAVAFLFSSEAVRHSRTERQIAWAACTLVFPLLAGLSFVQTGYWHDSPALFNRALAIDPSCDVAYSNLAADALVAGRRADALGFAQQAVRFGPERAQNQVTLGIILQQLGRHNEAGVAFLHASEADPGNVVALTGLAEELGRAGQTQKAIAICRAALQTWPESSYPHRCMALLQSQQGQQADALREAETAVRLDPSDALCRVTYGQLLDKAGRHAEAAGQYALAAALSSHPSQAAQP